MKKIIALLTIALTSLHVMLAAPDFVLKSGQRVALYLDPAKPAAPVVRSAIEMLTEDMQQVLSAQLNEVADPSVADITVGIDTALHNPNATLGRWETFSLRVGTGSNGKGQLQITGSDARGAAYGLLEVSRLLGVSPLTWWSECHPEPLESLHLPADYNDIQSPSVQYRGIFINDEDEGFTPWSKETFEPGLPDGKCVGPKTYEQVYRMMLRLRANCIWPAMHPSTTPFFTVPGNREMAARYGITVGTSHCEPMMRAALEWDEKTMGPLNYAINRDSILRYWEERVSEVAGNDNFYTIGMRGVHDLPMQGANTVEGKCAIVEQAIADQRALLRQYVDSDVTRVPQLFVPYKEVLDLYNNGLKVPDDVTLMWCDDNFGYLTRLSNATEQKRQGGAGIYYHISYWGRPHAYCWLCTTPPALIYSEMRKAYDANARKIWIVNVGDVKPGESDMEMFLNMAWNIDYYNAQNLDQRQQEWLAREFGPQVASAASPLLNEYYRLCFERKPEMMAWSRLEEPQPRGDKSGRTPAEESEYNPQCNDNEWARRLDDFHVIVRRADSIAQTLPQRKREAWFSLVQMQIEAASAMNDKWLYAQQERILARSGNADSAHYAQLTMAACQRIDSIIAAYNAVGNGKWQHIMRLPNWPIPVNVAPDLTGAKFVARPMQPSRGEIINITDFEGEYTTIPLLGYSQNAIALPVGTEKALSSKVRIPQAGEVVIRVGMIPCQPLRSQDLRFAISVDDGPWTEVSFRTDPVGRDEPWKVNVLRNQSVTCLPYTFSRAGEHTLRICALDPDCLLDQLQVLTDKDMQFYGYPKH